MVQVSFWSLYVAFYVAFIFFNVTFFNMTFYMLNIHIYANLHRVAHTKPYQMQNIIAKYSYKNLFEADFMCVTLYVEILSI